MSECALELMHDHKWIFWWSNRETIFPALPLQILKVNACKKRRMSLQLMKHEKVGFLLHLLVLLSFLEKYSEIWPMPALIFFITGLGFFHNSLHNGFANDYYWTFIRNIYHYRDYHCINKGKVCYKRLLNNHLPIICCPWIESWEPVQNQHRNFSTTWSPSVEIMF